MNILSLFDGMSVGQLSLNELGLKIDKYLASEIKPQAIAVTQYNFPNTIQLGDVCNININDLPKIDLLIGGSPCQNFSQACITSHRLGLDGVKSKLFYEYLRLLKETKPKYFLLENVASMKQSDQDIISNLVEAQPIRINSKLITAQLRDRLYWTNINVTKELVDKNIYLQDILTNGYTDRLKSRCLMEGDSRPLSTPIKMFHRYYSTGFTTLIFKDSDHYYKCVQHYNNYFHNMSANQISVLIENNINIDLSVYDGVRYLNKIELERLQTIPEGYTSILKRNDAASLLGDGWTKDVITFILSHIE